MNLFPDLARRYTQDRMSAREAQRMAEFIAFGPAVFETARLMVSFGILDAVRDSDVGLTADEIVAATGLSGYAVKVLTEASLSIGLLTVDTGSDRFSITKTGWFLLNDKATRVNMEFNHDVNYLGWYDLETALREGRPAGLRRISDAPTVYEGLSTLPPQVQRSWFAFDHFYSDHSFDEALKIVFGGGRSVRRLMDVGGNTGRWALRCVAYDPDVRVTIVDLPQQIGLMRDATAGEPGAERIDGYGMDMLDAGAEFPVLDDLDAVWMSQFLDCFGPEEIVSILTRVSRAMGYETRLYIMETLWDRQRFEPAAMCLTLTSLYFTAIANGNSKMYHGDELMELIRRAGLEIETIHDGLGQGHSILVCKKV